MEREGANEANIMIRVLSVVLSISAAPALAADKPARPIEDGAKQIAGVWQFPEYIASCLKIDAIRNKGLADLIHKCLSFSALKRPERMSEVQGILDQLADEAAAKLDPDELEE